MKHEIRRVELPPPYDLPIYRRGSIVPFARYEEIPGTLGQTLSVFMTDSHISTRARRMSEISSGGQEGK